MRLGILGGTFDPIHLGHLLTAEAVYDQLQLDRILFVLAGDPPHKQAINKTPIYHRWTMVHLAIADNPRFILSSVDLERPGPHFSVETVRLIRSQYHLTAEECVFIIGGDSLVNLPTWHKPQQFIELCRLAVVHRPGYQPDMPTLETALPGITKRVDWIETPEIGLASSHVRENIQQGRSARYQLPPPVINYIKQYQLYQA